MLNQVKDKLKELGFNDNEVKVYLALTQLGEGPASKIAKKASLPRTTVISILEKLQNQGFVTTHKYRGVTQYWVEAPKTLKQVFENKIKVAEDLDKLMSEVYRSEKDFPYARVYDTQASIKKYIEKELINLKAKSIIKTIDYPGMGNYTKIYSQDLDKILINLKNKKGLVTHTLVPFGTAKEIEQEKLKRQSIVIKELPKGIEFTASIWLVNNKLVLFSGKMPFLVEISHSLIVSSLESIYNFFWHL